ncbi:MAG: ATP phosphoribosyltransferase [Deltaproteobacteria bacterium]|nr:ATP phosphoribosyltransferase [Deltaproteobacteria bacterium]
MNGNGNILRLALPKGRMQAGVLGLLTDAGIDVRVQDRGYRPSVSLAGLEVKVLKPQNIVKMLGHGSRDAGFAGADWVAELGADLVEILDTGLDPVRMVAAAPEDLLASGKLPRRRLVVASEYETLTGRWIERAGIDASTVRSYGATEVFPPEDADLIVDLVATGSTLRANKLVVVDEIMASSTRLYASPGALEDPGKKRLLDKIVMLLGSVLEARQRVMVEVNVPGDRLEAVIEVLPCMREPTMSPLYGGGGYAVKAAVPRDQLPEVIPEIKRCGGTDVVVTRLVQIVP